MARSALSHDARAVEDYDCVWADRLAMRARPEKQGKTIGQELEAVQNGSYARQSVESARESPPSGDGSYGKPSFETAPILSL